MVVPNQDVSVILFSYCIFVVIPESNVNIIFSLGSGLATPHQNITVTFCLGMSWPHQIRMSLSCYVFPLA